MSGQRETKFRAWNTIRKAWDVFYIPVSLFPPYNELDKAVSVAFENSECDYDLAYEHWGQYTGLKDKNGKEIWEGDIFQFHYLDGPGGRGVVIWQDEIAAWVWYPPEHGEGMSTLMPESNVMEVIGNVHDNPELLEGK